MAKVQDTFNRLAISTFMNVSHLTVYMRGLHWSGPILKLQQVSLVECYCILWVCLPMVNSRFNLMPNGNIRLLMRNIFLFFLMSGKSLRLTNTGLHIECCCIWKHNFPSLKQMGRSLRHCESQIPRVTYSQSYLNVSRFKKTVLSNSKNGLPKTNYARIYGV